MNHYVLGIAFSQNLLGTVLIRKSKPSWQVGHYNGVGGRIEAGETPASAMVREFEEETSVVTQLDDWHLFTTMQSVKNSSHADKEPWIVYCYTTKLTPSQIDSVKTTTEEPVLVTSHFSQLKMVRSMNFLVPLARESFTEPKDVDIFYY